MHRRRAHQVAFRAHAPEGWGLLGGALLAPFQIGPEPMSGWTLACALEELPEGKGRHVELQGLALCLVRTGSAVYAVENRCPHRGARLSGGLVYDGCKVACPDHGWTIDLPTGSVEPPEQGKVRRYRVELRDGGVHVDLTPLQ